MVRLLVLQAPGMLALLVGLSVGDAQGWRVGLLWGVVTYVVLLTVVIALFRLRRHGKASR